MKESVADYLQRHVYCRCEQAVSRLAAGELMAMPPLGLDSEREIFEWWLVSPELGPKLQAAGLPVARFAELYMWGRRGTAGDLASDLDLRAALS